MGRLQDLMQPDNVTFDEIRAVVAERGYYPRETAETAYDEGFVKAVLIGAWPQVLQTIKEKRGK